MIVKDLHSYKQQKDYLIFIYSTTDDEEYKTIWATKCLNYRSLDEYNDIEIQKATIELAKFFVSEKIIRMLGHRFCNKLMELRVVRFPNSNGNSFLCIELYTFGRPFGSV